MENTTRLLQRHAERLAESSVLIVDADDAALADLPTRGLVMHADLVTVPAAQHQPAPSLPADTDLLVVILPKSRERLSMLLGELARQLSVPTALWLVGPGKGGVKGAVRVLSEHADDVALLDSARHCKLYGARLRPAAGSALTPTVCWQYDDLLIYSLPGVFSHGRLDEGTALLLNALRRDMPDGSVLDMGCGAGVLSAFLARVGCRVTGCDASASAVAATRATLVGNQLAGEVLQSDLYRSLGDRRFDAIVTNPPFHDGLQQSTAVSARLIREAPRHLRAAGVLWLVANQGLPYEKWLRESFRHIEVADENRRYRVWRASL